MDAVDQILRDLADDPDDYQREGGLVVFTRHGQELSLTLADVPGGGPSVKLETGQFVPLATYVQAHLLQLPRLARQVTKTLEKLWDSRPLRYVEGPARTEHAQWAQAGPGLRSCLITAEPGTTHLVQLMGRAGEGKTALLEHLAIELGSAYQPDPYPSPLLLPVDLLGRYVGTVDDAIAGALNNTYSCPGMSQRDVALCIRRRWLILALDAFDELVARVGPRDAFLRITELLEQLDGSGTVVLSARESFFDLYQITSAIRSYLQPRKGSYTTTLVVLQPWDRSQGVEVFSKLDSPQPEADIDGLLAAFGDDRDLVFQPFFLTRLAKLWRQGERFKGAGQLPDELGRVKFIIETFVAREAAEKWIGRDSKPLLTPDQHAHVLAVIAEEMWRSGAFQLSADEVRIAAAVAFDGRNLPREVVDSAIERIPTHGVLTTRAGRLTFLHDQFLSYYLGLRLKDALAGGELVALQAILSARNLTREAVEWAVYFSRSSQVQITTQLGALEKCLQRQPGDQTTADNVGALCGRILNDRVNGGPIVLTRITFAGEALARGKFRSVEFQKCSFWHANLAGSEFHGCRFEDCKFGDVRIDGSTKFQETTFHGCDVRSLDCAGEHSYFAPEEIAVVLRRAGARIESVQPPPPPVQSPTTREDVVAGVESFVRASQRSTDVAIEDMEARIGDLAKMIRRFGIESGVLRDHVRSTSGPSKTFVRFDVDRTQLLRGSGELTRVASIDDFWSKLRKKYPVKRTGS